MAYRITQLAFPFDSELRLSRRRCKPNKAKRYADLMGIKGPASPSKPAVHTPHLSRSAAIEAFTPFEHAVLSALFKIPRLHIARDIDIWAAVDNQGKTLLNREVKADLIPGLSLRNAVARIILKTVEDRLPNYYSPGIKKFVRKPGIGATGKRISESPQRI